MTTHLVRLPPDEFDEVLTGRRLYALLPASADVAEGDIVRAIELERIARPHDPPPSETGREVYGPIVGTPRAFFGDSSVYWLVSVRWGPSAPRRTGSSGAHKAVTDATLAARKRRESTDRMPALSIVPICARVLCGHTQQLHASGPCSLCGEATCPSFVE